MILGTTEPIRNFVIGVSQLLGGDSVLYPQYRDDPVGFSRDILGVSWTDKIRTIALALRDHEKIVVPAGHAVGKTHGVAGIVIWWLSTRETKVVTTAPTWRQVKDLIWREIRHQHTWSRKTLPGSPITVEWNLAEEWFATGISTNDPERFQGYHADELLVVIDEGSGVEKFIWDAIVDSLAVSEGNRVLAIGNPTDPTSRFAQASRSSEWKTFTLSCLDHPNVVEGRNVIKGAVSKRWVDERVRRWCVPYSELEGEEHTADVFEYDDQLYIPNDMFRIRVLGQFPVEGGSQVIPLHYIEHAFNREPIEPEGLWYIGLDVARFGNDNSVLTLGAKNGVVKDVDIWQGARTTTSAGRAKWWVAQVDRVEKIGVDVIGLGSGTVDTLAEANYPVVAVNVAERAYDVDMYPLLRDELYFDFADQLRLGNIDLTRVSGFEEQITEELAAHTYDYTKKGQRKVMPKEHIKDKIGRSPDFADSLVIWNGVRDRGDLMPETVPKDDSWQPQSWADLAR